MATVSYCFISIGARLVSEDPTCAAYLVGNLARLVSLSACKNRRPSTQKTPARSRGSFWVTDELRSLRNPAVSFIQRSNRSDFTVGLESIRV